MNSATSTTSVTTTLADEVLASGKYGEDVLS